MSRFDQVLAYLAQIYDFSIFSLFFHQRPLSNDCRATRLYANTTYLVSIESLYTHLFYKNKVRAFEAHCKPHRFKVCFWRRFFLPKNHIFELKWTKTNSNLYQSDTFLTWNDKIYWFMKENLRKKLIKIDFQIWGVFLGV